LRAIRRIHDSKSERPKLGNEAKDLGCNPENLNIDHLIVTAIIAVNQYLRQRRELIEQNNRYQEQRTKDFNSIIYRARLDTYIEVTDALAKFSRSTTEDEAKKAATRFWELYHAKRPYLRIPTCSG
jgi:hypothetical protein